MARMVATKAALSIRLDALADADSKSAEGAPTIGLEARAKLESRLRALEHHTGVSGIRANRGPDAGYKQQPFKMSGNGASYNTAADDVPAAQIGAPATPAGKSTVDVDGTPATEKKLSKEERKALKQAKKAEAASGKCAENVEVCTCNVTLTPAVGCLLDFTEPSTPARAGTASEVATPSSEKKSKKEKKDKKKRSADELDGAEDVTATPNGAEDGERKKKKKKKDKEASA